MTTICSKYAVPFYQQEKEAAPTNAEALKAACEEAVAKVKNIAGMDAGIANLAKTDATQAKNAAFHLLKTNKAVGTAWMDAGATTPATPTPPAPRPAPVRRAPVTPGAGAGSGGASLTDIERLHRELCAAGRSEYCSDGDRIKKTSYTPVGARVEVGYEALILLDDAMNFRTELGHDTVQSSYGFTMNGAGQYDAAFGEGSYGEMHSVNIGVVYQGPEIGGGFYLEGGLSILLSFGNTISGIKVDDADKDYLGDIRRSTNGAEYNLSIGCAGGIIGLNNGWFNPIAGLGLCGVGRHATDETKNVSIDAGTMDSEVAQDYDNDVAALRFSIGAQIGYFPRKKLMPSAFIVVRGEGIKTFGDTGGVDENTKIGSSIFGIVIGGGVSMSF